LIGRYDGQDVPVGATGPLVVVVVTVWTIARGTTPILGQPQGAASFG
jgi:hypothetical protein